MVTSAVFLIILALISFIFIPKAKLAGRVVLLLSSLVFLFVAFYLIIGTLVYIPDPQKDLDLVASRTGFWELKRKIKEIISQNIWRVK